MDGATQATAAVPGSQVTEIGAARRGVLRHARVYLIWTPEAASGDPFTAAELALAGGHVAMLQLRMKNATREEGLAAGRRLREHCTDRGVLFLVNDDIGLARELRADGVHLGQADAEPEDAREALGPDVLIGLSTHGPDEIRAARERPVDYVGLGPCYPTESKTPTYAPGGPALVKAGLPAAGPLPVFPIGGITGARAAELASAGARAIAVGAGVLAARGPGAAAEAIHRALAPVP